MAIFELKVNDGFDRLLRMVERYNVSAGLRVSVPSPAFVLPRMPHSFLLAFLRATMRFRERIRSED
jgi:hypothetical protein